MTFAQYMRDRYAAAAMDTDWGAHDRRFHGGSFDPKTMKCSLREDLADADGVDDLGNPKTDSKDAAGPKRWVEFLSLVEKRKGGRDVTPSDIEQMYGELQKIGDRREKRASAWWLAHGTIRLPEDASKVRDALDVAAKARKDPLSYRSPMELILDNREFRPSEKPIDPDTVPELSDRTDMGHGVVTYLVQDDRDGQKAMRRIIDTHWGRDANPWCLLARDEDEYSPYSMEDWWNGLSEDEKDAYRERIEFYTAHLPEDVRDDLEAQSSDVYYESDGEIDEDIRDLAARRWWRENIKTPSDEGLGSAWRYWKHYSALPKRVAFKDGKLLSFMATHVENTENIDDIEYKISDELNNEFFEYIMEDGHEDAMIEDWLQENHPDVWYDLVGDGDIPEQWWDRKDEPHGGVPLSGIPIEGDRLNRSADYEMQPGGGMKMVGNPYIGKEDTDGYVEWGPMGNVVKVGRVEFDRMFGTPTTYSDGDHLFLLRNGKVMSVHTKDKVYTLDEGEWYGENGLNASDKTARMLDSMSSKAMEKVSEAVVKAKRLSERR